MAAFLLIIGIWWIIHFAHYTLGRIMVTNVPEERIIEIMSSPMLFSTNDRRTKKIERWSIFISLLLLYPLIKLYCWIFEAIQAFILPQTGINFTDDGLFVPAILVALGTLYLLVVKMAGMGITQDKNWRAQPTLKQVQIRIFNVKKWSIRFSWISQIVFIFFMYHYVNIDNQGVKYSSLWDLGTKKYEYDDFIEASLSIKTQAVYRRGMKSKEFLKHYWLHHTNGKRIELWNDFGWNEKRLERLIETTRILQENNVFIDIDYPSFLDWSEYERNLSPENFKVLKNLFESCRSIADDIPDLIPPNRAIRIDSLFFRLDSTTRGNRQQEGGYFFKPSEGNIYQYVHLTVENNRTDSFYVNGFNLRIFDENDSSYIHSLWLDETFVNNIPPDTTHSGYFIFQVPIDAANLRLRYRYGFINSRTFWFDLNQKD